MGWWLRLVPVLLAVVSAVVLSAGGDEALSAVAVVQCWSPETPEVSAGVVRPPRPPVLAGRVVAHTPASEVAPGPEVGPAVVTVVGLDGPVHGVGVDVFGLDRDRHRRGQTDTEGRIRLKNVPYDGSVSVLVDGLRELHPEGPEPSRAHAVIRGPSTTVEIADVMLMETHFRDAETGEHCGNVNYRLRTHKLDESEVCRHATRYVRARPGRTMRVLLYPEPPPGLVAFDGTYFSVDVSRRATMLSLTATLRQEANVFLRAFDVEGHPVSDAEVVGIEVAGKPVRGTKLTARDVDRLRVRGVPFLRGEGVRVVARRPSPSGARETWETTKRTGRGRNVGDLLPDDVWRGWDLDPGLGAIAKGRLPQRVSDELVLVAVFDPRAQVRGLRGWRDLGGGSGSRRRLSGPRGALEVRVVDVEGHPIGGARVHVRGRWVRSDLLGRAHFPDVPAGERRVTLHEPGWVRTTRAVQVDGGETTRATLVEDEGGELLVRVLGDDGLPLTGARIDVPEYLAWADVRDDIQILDVATNHLGERLLSRFPRGRATIRVRWGRRHGEGTVYVDSGRRQVLELRLSPTD